MILYVNTGAQSPASALVTDITTTVPEVAPTFVYGDVLPIDLYLVDGLGYYDERSGLAAVGVRTALGLIGGPNVAFQGTWSQIPHGFHCYLNLLTVEGDALLPMPKTGVKVLFEIEVSDPSTKQTVLQIEVDFLRDLIGETAPVPTPGEEFLNKQETEQNFIQNRFGISG